MAFAEIDNLQSAGATTAHAVREQSPPLTVQWMNGYNKTVWLIGDISTNNGRGQLGCILLRSGFSGKRTTHGRREPAS